MNQLTPYFVVLWTVLVIGAFPILGSPRRAILFIIISGAMFLPEAVSNFVKIGPLRFEKQSAICYAAFFGAMLFNLNRLFTVRITVFDLPAIVWCLCPIPSVLTNDAPPDGSSILYDALSQTWGNISQYGFPYLLGRIYFTDRESIRELGLAVVTGAMVYIPLCLYEMKMSPQLHSMVYGYPQQSFIDSIRFGGYRPVVFFQHGLSLSMFMLSAALYAFWMQRGEEFRQPKPGQALMIMICRYSPWVLFVMNILFKSTGALILGLMGAVTFILAPRINLRIILLSLVAVPVFYVAVRTSGLWTGESLVQLVSNNISTERAQSLDTRTTNENALMKHAFLRPWFGWDGWGRNRLFTENNEDACITDGFWIIILGVRGFFGLVGFGGLLLLPVVRFAFLTSSSNLRQMGSSTASAFVLVFWTIDCLPNAMPLAIYFLIAGGLTGLRLPVKRYLA